MSFLNSALFIFLLPLLALPLVIHLLNKGFPKHLRFPSVKLIQETMARRSKVYQWRHWILLLLRTIFLTLLLLAFLLPVIKRFNTDPAAKGKRHVLIVFDHSVSMEHQGDGPTSRERAKHEAVKLIDSLDSADSINVLLMESAPTTCFADFSRDHSEAKRFVNQLKPGFTRTDVNLANAMIAQLMPKEVSRPEIYYLSDFQRKNWANANFTAVPAGAKLFFVDVGATQRDNRAILDVRLPQTQILADETVPLEVSIGNYSHEPFNGRVTAVVDQHFTFDQEISIPPWSEGKTTVPVSVGGPGVHLCEVRLPPDALDYDNHFRLSLAVQEKEEVLIVSDGPNDASSGAYFIKTALNPFENEAGSLMPHIVSSSELTPSRLAGVRKVFFTHLNRLNEETCDTTAKFLFQGGGLIFFLDGPADADNLSALERVIGPNTMPLHLALKRTATNVVSGAQQVVRGDFKSPYLKLFQGAARQNLALLEFYDYYQAGVTSAGGVLLAYADDSPAMAALHHGLGTMLLLNFSASEFSSNLARQRIFPAWMQELVKALDIDEPQPSAHTIGETLHTEVWRNEMRDQEFKNPTGAAVTVKREPEGERYRITFTPDQLGFYTLGTSRPLYAFGINTSPDEADLRPIDKDALPKEFAAGHETYFVAGADDFDELAHGQPIFHWFVLASAAVLLLESAFQFILRRRAL